MWYGRVIRCLDKQDFLPRRTEHFAPNGMLYKIRTIDCVESIAGHPTPVEITMEVVPERTSSRIVLRNVEYATGLPDEVFDGR